MQVGDVVLVKTDGDTELRWVGVVSKVDGDFIEYVALCTTLRKGERMFYCAESNQCRDASGLEVIGNVEQSVAAVREG